MSEFKVGDKLRIRQWEDMKEEFGTDYNGAINCKYDFTEEMKHLCGLPFTVSNIEFGEYFSVEGTEDLRYDGMRDRWFISADMLEYADEDPMPLTCDVDGLFELGFGGAV